MFGISADPCALASWPSESRPKSSSPRGPHPHSWPARLVKEVVGLNTDVRTAPDLGKLCGWESQLVEKETPGFTVPSESPGQCRSFASTAGLGGIVYTAVMCEHPGAWPAGP